MSDTISKAPVIRFEDAPEGDNSQYDLEPDRVVPRQVEDDIEVFVEGDEGAPVQVDEEKRKLLKELEESRSETQSAKARADEVAALRSAFEKMGETLKPKPQAQQQAPAFRRLDPNQFNEKFLENPYQRISEATAQTIGPVFQMLQNTNMATARELAEIKHKDSFKVYGPEIDQVVQGMTPQEKLNPTMAYNRAVQAVRQNHFDDIVKGEVERALAEREKKSSNGSPTFSEGGGPASRPPVQRRQVTLTRSQAEEADRKGIPRAEMARIIMRRRG